MHDLGKILLDHYTEYLGDYIGVDLYSDNNHKIQLLGFDKAIEDCLVLATLGLSNYSESINNCCEVIIATDSDYDECAKFFMNAIFYVVQNNMDFGRGVWISGVDNISEGFAKRHNKAAIYFTESYILPEDFSTVEDKYKIYMGFFISQDEVNYLEKYGCEKFEDLLEEKEIDLIDLNRKSVV